MRAIVLVGGFGTRLRPLTSATPKQMLPVAGQPMIERVVGHLVAHGVDEVVLSLGFRAEVFTDAYPDGTCAGARLVCAAEPEPLDTAGGIAFAARAAGIDERFLVVNGDVLTDVDVSALVAFHEQAGAEGTILLAPVDDPSQFGVVPTDDDGRVQAFVEKPPVGEAPTNLINAGYYVLEPSVVDRVPVGARVNIERVTFPAMVADGRLFARHLPAWWIDVGTPERFLEANVHYAGAPTVVDPTAVIADGAVVDRSVVMADARVEAGAVVRGSIVGAGATVGAGAVVDEPTVVGPGRSCHPVPCCAALESPTSRGPNAEASVPHTPRRSTRASRAHAVPAKIGDVRALVAGGAGFLGAKVVERLIAEGHEVDVLDDLSTGSLTNLAAARVEGRGRLRIHQVDATAETAADLVARRRPEVVFHLVDRRAPPAEDGSGGHDPVADVALTVGSALRMVDGALRGGAAKLVHVLDAAALYGAADPSSFPLRESEPPAPVDHHGVATWAVVEHLRVARRTGGLEFTSLAMATLYGPGDRRGPVATVFATAAAGSPATDGQGLDLLFVDDAVDAVVRAAERGGGLLVNVGSGRSVGAEQLAALVAGSEEPSGASGSRRAARGFALDPGRARLHLGWAPWTGLDEGLRMTRRWLDRS